jgi:hypothetical protein
MPVRAYLERRGFRWLDDACPFCRPFDQEIVMRFVIRGALFAAALLLLGASVDAQQSCYTCDPQYSSCSTQCYYCDGPEHPDGYCNYGDEVWTTCGDYMAACHQDGCTSNWVTTDRTNVGTYGETTYGISCTWGGGCVPTWGCEHHRVDRVTQEDVNQCNLSSSYWTRQYCHDWVDGAIPHQQGSIPNCCSVYSGWSCNDWHSCF